MIADIYWHLYLKLHSHYWYFCWPILKKYILYTQEYLDISGNQFSGTLPDGFYNLESLRWVFLSNNKFFGSIQSAIENLSSLEDFDISNNKFEGGIPSEIGSLVNLKLFIIFSNMFTGTIPPELASLEQIQMLKVHQNEFSGTISNQFCGLYEDPHSLSMFYADCGPTDIIGPPAIVCECCTHCCDIVQKNCTKSGSVVDVPDDGLG